MNLKNGIVYKGTFGLLMILSVFFPSVVQSKNDKNDDDQSKPVEQPDDDDLTPEQLKIKDKIMIRIARKEKRKTKPMCVKDLVQSYGLMGFQSPREQSLDMCSEIKHTCCTYDDQLEIFNTLSVDMKNLRSRTRKYENILHALYKELGRIESVIERMYVRQQKRGISNCKILVYKLAHFNITGIIPKLKHHIEEMHNFLKDSYKGFYCTICDAEQNQFIDPKTKIMFFNRGFCRKLVTSSLHSMLYLHDDFIRYLNLMVKFVSYCDAMGRFDYQPLNERVVMRYGKHSKISRKCFESRNDPSWAAKCTQFCKSFNPVQMTEFFEPYVEKFIYIAELLKARRLHFEYQEKHEALLHLPDEYKDPKEVNKRTHGRILDQGQGSNNSTAGEAGNSTNGTNGTDDDDMDKHLDISSASLKIIMLQMKKRDLFAKGVGAVVDLSQFKIMFQSRGIDYFKMGKMTMLNKVLGKKIFEVIDKRKHPEDYERVLSHAGVLVALFGLVTTLLSI